MLEAKLTIEAPELADAIMALALAIGNRASGYTPEATTGRKRRATKSEAPAPVPIPTAAPSETPATATPGTVAPVTAPDGTWEPGGNAAVEQPVTKPAAPEKPSMEVIANAGAALCEQGKTNELVSLLNSYGVQTVTQAYNLDDAAFANFLAGLRALGAQV